MKRYVRCKFWCGFPENLKDCNDGENWWVCQFHFLPFIMYQLDDEHRICFGWLFWSGTIWWFRKQTVEEDD